MKSALRMPLVVLLVAAVALVIGSSTQVEEACAVPGFFKQWTFYANPQHVGVVGEVWTSCCGRASHSWGEVTSYCDVEVWDCGPDCAPDTLVDFISSNECTIFQ